MAKRTAPSYTRLVSALINTAAEEVIRRSLAEGSDLQTSDLSEIQDLYREYLHGLVELGIPSTRFKMAVPGASTVVIESFMKAVEVQLVDGVDGWLAPLPCYYQTRNQLLAFRPHPIVISADGTLFNLHSQPREKVVDLMKGTLQLAEAVSSGMYCGLTAFRWRLIVCLNELNAGRDPFA